jgi:hypothetical protein
MRTRPVSNRNGRRERDRARDDDQHDADTTMDSLLRHRPFCYLDVHFR